MVHALRWLSLECNLQEDFVRRCYPELVQGSDPVVAEQDGCLGLSLIPRAISLSLDFNG